MKVKPFSDERYTVQPEQAAKAKAHMITEIDKRLKLSLGQICLQEANNCGDQSHK